ncbi:TPA: hypothetical protein DCZ39_01245, partial [Patescibacteria group bacterium]|nr:hypothetical protein [Candidatus Gracilibacteria bacterium]
RPKFTESPISQYPEAFAMISNVMSPHQVPAHPVTVVVYRISSKAFIFPNCPYTFFIPVPAESVHA